MVPILKISVMESIYGEIVRLTRLRYYWQTSFGIISFAKDGGVIDIVERSMKGEITNGVDLHFSLPSGKVVGAPVTTAPMKNAKGEIIGAISTVSDITERKLGEEKLRNLFEKFFRKHTAIFLLINGETGQIIEANDGH